jgi:hypothetical protein
VALLTLLALAGAGTRLAAQGNCNVNREGACQVGATAAYALNITIAPVVRLSLPNNAIALGTATPAEFTAGFGTPVEVPLSIRANTGWAISIAVLSPVWSAAPASAWQTKPVSDLGWGASPVGPFADMGGTPATVQSGGATGNTVIPLYLRARYGWATDSPGSYSLPLQITITAP